MSADWLKFAQERRAKRAFTPARAPHKLTLANLAKSWHIDKEKLASLIEKIYKEKHGQSNPTS